MSHDRYPQSDGAPRTVQEALNEYPEAIRHCKQWQKDNQLVRGDHGLAILAYYLNLLLPQEHQIDVSILSRFLKGQYAPTARVNASWWIIDAVRKLCPYPIEERAPLPLPRGPARVFVLHYNNFHRLNQAMRRICSPREMLRRSGRLFGMARGGGRSYSTRQHATAVVTARAALDRLKKSDLRPRSVADLIAWVTENWQSGMDAAAACDDPMVLRRLDAMTGTCLFQLGLWGGDPAAQRTGWELVRRPVAHRHEQKEMFCDEVVSCIRLGILHKFGRAETMAREGLRLAVRYPWPHWASALVSDQRNEVVLKEWRALDPRAVDRLLGVKPQSRKGDSTVVKKAIRISAAVLFLAWSLAFQIADGGPGRSRGANAGATQRLQLRWVDS
jgi:hypothetical protein